MVALKTFTNLPEARQAEIIAVCLEEFALQEYQTASLSAIVSNLNLAKGSFYRYFENKSSLYFYLFEHCAACRIKNDEKYIDPAVTDFFELTAQHFLAKINFDKTYPLHSAFLYNVLQERNNEELGNIRLKSKTKFLGMIRKMVQNQIKNQVLRKDIDVDLIAFSVWQTQLSINEYISLKYAVDFRENIRTKKRLYDLPEKELLKVSGQFIKILKNGIEK